MTNYDLIAIGGGSGGIAAAVRAARHGARTLVIESDKLGGTCVNRGCVPKKLMWYGAATAHRLHEASELGFDVEVKGLDWSTLMGKRDAYVNRVNGWYGTYLQDSDVEFIAGQARFVEPKILEVGGQRVFGEHIVIAVGGEPVVPDLPGAELGITSDGFFELEAAPPRVAIVGSGYIAVELAGMLNAFGSDVTMFLRGHHLLRPFDESLRDHLMETMVDQGINVLPRVQADRLERHADGRVIFHCTDGSTPAPFDALIWAVGRRPLTAGLGLEHPGVTTDGSGFIPVDDMQNTNVERIYAVGDVTGRPALTPVAVAAGRRLGDRLFGGQPERHLDYSLVPTVVFSHPPIATVGLTEAEALETHGDAVKVYQARFTAMYESFKAQKQRTLMKLVTIGAKERIVGLHMMGPDVDEILQGFTVAMRMGATKRDFDETIAIHPTSAEELVTLR